MSRTLVTSTLHDPFEFFRDATTSGSYLYMVDNQHLMRSDGTQAGTFDLASIGLQFDAQLTDVNGTLFFQGYDATNGFELWRSDGTVAGTRLVKNLSSQPSASTITSLRPANNVLYFLSEGNLYRTDGTASGTNQVVDVSTRCRRRHPQLDGTQFKSLLHRQRWQVL